MLEVATGIDGCSGKEDTGTQPGYPVPPVEKPDQTPEKVRDKEITEQCNRMKFFMIFSLKKSETGNFLNFN